MTKTKEPRVVTASGPEIDEVDFKGVTKRRDTVYAAREGRRPLLFLFYALELHDPFQPIHDPVEQRVIRLPFSPETAQPVARPLRERDGRDLPAGGRSLAFHGETERF